MMRLLTTIVAAIIALSASAQTHSSRANALLQRLPVFEAGGATAANTPAKGPARAYELLKKYYGQGYNLEGEERTEVEWVMSATRDIYGEPIFSDVIPNPWEETLKDIVVQGFEYDLVVYVDPYACVTDGYTWTAWLCSISSDDGVIRMAFGEDGSLTPADDEVMAYVAFPKDADFDPTFETALGIVAATEVKAYNSEPSQPIEVVKLFEELGETVDEYQMGSVAAGLRDIVVEGYSDYSVIVRGWMGQEGYDIKVDYDLFSGCIEVVTPLNSEQAPTPVYEGSWAMVRTGLTGAEEPYLVGIYVAPTYAMTDGQTFMYFYSVYYYPNGENETSYYLLYWPQSEEQVEAYTLAQLRTLQTEEEVLRDILLDLNNTAVTFADPEGTIAIIEDKSAGACLTLDADSPEFRTGMTITGKMHADYYADSRRIVPRSYDECILAQTDVSRGTPFYTLEEIADPDNFYRLITVYNTDETPFTNTAQGIVLDENIRVADLHGILTQYDGQFPDEMECITGYVTITDSTDAQTGQSTELYTIVPRSEADIRGTYTAISTANANASAAPAYNLNGQRVSDSYRGIIVRNGKARFNP